MRKYLLLASLLFGGLSAAGQINVADSSVQVITYWDLGDTYTYDLSLQTLQFNESDTLSNVTMTYTVDITVVDSTAETYVVRWLYRDFTTDSPDTMVQQMATLSENIAVDIVTDELGVIQGIANWEEVQEFMQRSIDELGSFYAAQPELATTIRKLRDRFATKAAIEATAIKDAHQFHNFHGAYLQLGETVEGRIMTPNVYRPLDPFDTEVLLALEEIYAEDEQYLVRSLKTVDSEQLTQTVYDYLREIATDMGQEFFSREDMQPVTNATETASVLHNTGWLIESREWITVTAEGVTNQEVRTIMLR